MISRTKTWFQRSYTADLCAIALALVHVAMALSAAKTKSPTFDEPTHFAAGYSYWLRSDFRLDAESGVLATRWAALPLLISAPHFPAEDAASWQSAAQGDVGSQFLYEVENNPDSLVLAGRAAMALTGCALCLVIYFWSKQLFGSAGGLISVTAAAFSPTLLAHTPLITSDATLALFLALATWAVWRMLHHVSARTIILSGLAVAGAILSKMSGLLIAPIIFLMIAVRLSTRDPLEIQFGRRTLVQPRKRRLAWIGAALLGVALIVWASIWLAYDFRFPASAQRTDSPFAGRFERLLGRGGVVNEALDFTRHHHLLPEAYVYGLAYAHANAQARPSFLDGNWSLIGFADFFPRAFFYKTPVPVLVLIALALAAAAFSARELAAKRIRQAAYHATGVFSLLGIYGLFALTARLNIGHRHILPLYPALFVACGACAIYFRRAEFRVVRFAIIVLLAWHICGSIAVHPNYLAYFNEIVGGPARGFTHLVDSSLDWGQDLPRLQQLLRSRTSAGEKQPVYLAYFGTGKPAHYGIEAYPLPATFAAGALPLLQLKSGLYCISATSLQHVYSTAMGPWCVPYEKLYQQLRQDASRFEEPVDGRSSDALRPPVAGKEELAGIHLFNELRFGRLCALLRHRRPTANAGHSILLFELSDADVHDALDGPPAELAPGIEVAGWH